MRSYYGKVNAPDVDDEDTVQPIIKRGTKARSIESQERYDRGRKPKGKRHYRKAGA